MRARTTGGRKPTSSLKAGTHVARAVAAIKRQEASAPKRIPEMLGLMNEMMAALPSVPALRPFSATDVQALVPLDERAQGGHSKSAIIALPLAINLAMKQRAREAGMNMKAYMEQVLTQHITGGEEIVPVSPLVEAASVVMGALGLTDNQIEQLFDRLVG